MTYAQFAQLFKAVIDAVVVLIHVLLLLLLLVVLARLFTGMAFASLPRVEPLVLVYLAGAYYLTTRGM